MNKSGTQQGAAMYQGMRGAPGDQGWMQPPTTSGYAWNCQTCDASGWTAMGQPSGGYEHTGETGHTTETSTEATTK